MTHEITADWSTLLRQAGDTAKTYFNTAVFDIDERFGEGYAAKHPELIAQYMRVCAHDFRTTTLMVAAQNLVPAIEHLADACESFNLHAAE